MEENKITDKTKTEVMEVRKSREEIESRKEYRTCGLSCSSTGFFRVFLMEQCPEFQCMG